MEPSEPDSGTAPTCTYLRVFFIYKPELKASFNCRVIGDRSVIGNGSRKLETEDSTLIVKPITASDAGFYKCIARNRAGFDLNIHLRLHAAAGSAESVPPIIDKTSRKIHVSGQDKLGVCV